MGNCLGMQEQVIKVMNPDGKILEYRAPIKVHQVLSEFPGHALSDTFPVSSHLRAETEMLAGSSYYVFPLPLQSPAVKKKKVRFSDTEEEDKKGTGVVRIKLIITKKELEEMLKKGGISVVDGMVSKIQEEQESMNGVDEIGGDESSGWKPLLESIPEID